MKSSAAEIFVTFSQVGFHCWPTAPEHRKYLHNLHRHRFNVTVQCEVYHDEREIEFHDLIDDARELFGVIVVAAVTSKSCETMARELARGLCQQHGRKFQVTVDEDGECGATVTYHPDGD
jgi:hypothetical protein